MTTNLAILGLGAMGSRMARRALADGPVTVWNRSRDAADPLLAAGARWADSPREAAASADIVLSIVTDDDAAEAVWLDDEAGACHGLRPKALAIECSTVTPGWINRLGEAVEARGAALIDAPVVGSTPQAEAGQLAALVGGSADDVERARPVLANMAKVVVHAGERSRGAVLKLLVNALFAGQVALLAELLPMASAAGLAQEKALELIAGLPVFSPAMAGVGALMLRGDHAPRFPVDLVAKDLRYALSLSALPVVEAALGRFDAASRAGLGGQNLTVIHKLAE